MAKVFNYIKTGSRVWEKHKDQSKLYFVKDSKISSFFRSHSTAENDVPASYSIDHSLKLVRVNLSENIGLDEIISILNDCVHDKNYQAGFNFLFDVRTISQYLTYSEMLLLFDQFKENLGSLLKGNFGILISKPIQYGITRIAVSIFSIKGINIDAFYSEEKALEWINTQSS